MAFSLIPSARTLFLRTNLRSLGRRTLRMSGFNLQKAEASLESNPYYSKYSQKIAALRQESPEEFEARLKEAMSKNTPKKKLEQSKPGFTVGQAKPKLDKQGLRPRLLNDVLKVDLLTDKTPEEIKFIWSEFHKTKDVVYATLEPAVFKRIHDNSAQFPLFLFPLPRDQGYEFIVCEFNGNTAHFTPLIAYQTHKENAPECLTMDFFDELSEAKGLVLMKGEFDKNVISVLDAQFLANNLQLYYAENNPRRLKLLETFNRKPDEFKYMDLVAEIDLLNIAVGKGNENSTDKPS